MSTMPQQDVCDQGTYLEAIRQALADALVADDTVTLYGQDIEDPFGGAFKATKGLSTRFPGRVRNAPINEDAMAGWAVGAALGGYRPVLEFQFADFSSVAFNQIVNQAGTAFWRTGKPCPLCIRLPAGGTIGSGPFHSQCPEAWYSHHPGLVVVAPASVDDAYHMLRQSIALNDPTIFIEHKQLYFHQRGTISAAPDLPLGRARVRREGGAATVLSYGAMVDEALLAADELAAEGVSVGVVDLRCLRPLDMETVLTQIATTGRVLIVSEAFPFGGVAAELTAHISEQGFHLLDAPPQRLCARDTPIPFHPDVWQAHRPQAADIADRLRQMIRY